jgi:hypothetical protein
MLEKWKVVVCTHLREQPSSRGLLPCNHKIAFDPCCPRGVLHFCHDMYPFFISFCYLFFVMGDNSADESSFDMGPNKQIGEKEALD